MTATTATASAQSGNPATGRGGSIFAATPVATGLDFVVGFTFAPSGRIYYGEKNTGEIRILSPNGETDRLFFDISNVDGENERGLLGIALHPSFPETPYVYAYVTRDAGGGARNQLVRMTAHNGHGSDFKVLFGFAVDANDHNGGRIAFGPDGRLYIPVGDNGAPPNSQDLDNLIGKVLRVNDFGGPAPGNPFGNRIWSYGLRNTIGFDFDPRTGNLWETENGPECTDELNRIVAGGNFGWGGNENCDDPKPGGTNQDGPEPRIGPEAYFASTIGPTGMAFCDRCGLGAGNDGRFLFGDCNTGSIRRVDLGGSREHVASQQVVLETDRCVFSMEAGTGRGLYFSNLDGIFKITKP